MSITADYINRLCHKGESNTLDYKAIPYPFGSANNHQKSELLKDILAFANADRDEAAYILIGVKEVNHLGVIDGISQTELIDDAKLQQFVNGKTNTPLVFNTYPVDCSGKLVQVIEIPECLKKRPFYIKSDFGGIKANVAKIRIGSSTADATLEMIRDMGETSFLKTTPTFDIKLSSPNIPVDANHFVAYAMDCTCDIDAIIAADETKAKQRVSWGYGKPILFQNKLKWLQDIFSTIKVDLYMKNTSSIQADNLYIEAFVSSDSNSQVCKIKRLPQKPQSGIIGIQSLPQILSDNMPQNYCLRPGQEDVKAYRFYFTVKESGTVTINIKIMGANIPMPIQKNFQYDVSVKNLSFDEKEIKNDFAYYEEENYFETVSKAINEKKQ